MATSSFYTARPAPTATTTSWRTKKKRMMGFWGPGATPGAFGTQRMPGAFDFNTTKFGLATQREPNYIETMSGPRPVLTDAVPVPTNFMDSIRQPAPYDYSRYKESGDFLKDAVGIMGSMFGEGAGTQEQRDRLSGYKQYLAQQQPTSPLTDQRTGAPQQQPSGLDLLREQQQGGRYGDIGGYVEKHTTGPAGPLTDQRTGAPQQPTSWSNLPGQVQQQPTYSDTRFIQPMGGTPAQSQLATQRMAAREVPIYGGTVNEPASPAMTQPTQASFKDRQGIEFHIKTWGLNMTVEDVMRNANILGMSPMSYLANYGPNGRNELPRVTEGTGVNQDVIRDVAPTAEMPTIPEDQAVTPPGRTYSSGNTFEQEIYAEIDKFRQQNGREPTSDERMEIVMGLRGRQGAGEYTPPPPIEKPTYGIAPPISGYQGESYLETQRKLGEATQYDFQQAAGQARDAMKSDMQRRGIAGSGLETETRLDLEGRLERARSAAVNADSIKLQELAQQQGQFTDEMRNKQWEYSSNLINDNWKYTNDLYNQQEQFGAEMSNEQYQYSNNLINEQWQFQVKTLEEQAERAMEMKFEMYKFGQISEQEWAKINQQKAEFDKTMANWDIAFAEDVREFDAKLKQGYFNAAQAQAQANQERRTSIIGGAIEIIGGLFGFG